MKFGIFDQNDRSGVPLQQLYEQRMQIAELYDTYGFHCYHMSEHHATSLSTTPSQSTFLAALSQRTKKLRLCPLVYLLPMHHPMRLAEEICMLDHLSNGRFEFGVGRGVSPHELEALGVDVENATAMYAEAFEIIEEYFTADRLNYSGRFWSFKDVPVELKPLQTPHPPIWYAVGRPESTVWPAKKGINIVCGGPAAGVRAMSDRFRQELPAAGSSRQSREPLIGVSRPVVVADTDADAMAIGREAWPVFHANFHKLWRRHGTQPRSKLPTDFDQLVAQGEAIAGSVETVTRAIARQVEDAGLTYFIGQFVFGNMPHAAAVQSVTLFGSQVIPALQLRSQAVAH